MGEGFEEIIKALSKNLEGTVFVGIVGRDGLPVSVISNENFERSESSAEMAGLFNTVQRIVKTLEMGEFVDLFFDTEKFGTLILRVNDSYFLVVIMRTPVNIGRARLEAKHASVQIRQMIEQ